MRLEIPEAVLGELQQLAEGMKSANISVTFTNVDETSVDLKKVDVKVVEGVYDLSLAVVDKDGTEKVLSSFSKPVQVSIAVSEPANKKLIRVYNLKGEFVDGKYKDGVLTAKLSNSSKYAILQLKK